MENKIQELENRVKALEDMFSSALQNGNIIFNNVSVQSLNTGNINEMNNCNINNAEIANINKLYNSSIDEAEIENAEMIKQCDIDEAEIENIEELNCDTMNGNHTSDEE